MFRNHALCSPHRARRCLFTQCDYIPVLSRPNSRILLGELSAGRVYPAPVSRVYVYVRSPRSRRGENALPSKWVRISVSRFSFSAFVHSFLRNSSVYVSRNEVGESDRERSKLPFKIGRFGQIKTNGCWCHRQFQLKDGSINVATVNGSRGRDERRVGLLASHL